MWETITQYIRLIKELTKQNTSTRMNQELTKAVLVDKESFQGYTALYKVYQDVRATIIETLKRKDESHRVGVADSS